MSRITERFAELQDRQEKALICFVTAGDPFPEHTAEVVVALAGAGCDVVELGIPFSDPLLDGPTIQASTQRALNGGMTPPKVLEVVRQVRTRSNIPLVLMGAYNPVLQYGPEKFARDAVAVGADGAILSDLSPEESGEWKRAADESGLDTIFLLAPTSTPARMALVGRMSRGFLYCMSRAGVTGARNDVPADLPPLIEAIRTYADRTPIGVGFGVSRPEQVAAIGEYADGVVVGAALVDCLYRTAAEGKDRDEVLRTASQFVLSLKAATRRSSM
ncbi:MAG: tryptophan synthase subunit alpha [Capsulimonadales bacterium]|nr:tryptophan synthase subunit alpha [Capsulimonadales bacterium]